ncbi:MAG: extracellular solute-binding protein [Anaerolineaceae bacterium]|nr:extracellular solute-binding protein [Anaerolineaceae bacterium]
MRLDKLRFWGLLGLLLVLGIVLPLAAQDNRIVISVAVPEFMGDTFQQDVFSQFEQENPGYKVHVVEVNNSTFSPVSPSVNLDGHLDAVASYAAMADVLFVTSNTISVEATRAGYILDLAPLVASDFNLDVNDFYPATWQAFQWDRGVWGFPGVADVQLLVYDRAKFDEIGLPYPDFSWNLDDLAAAADFLTVKDSSGQVTQPGMVYLTNDNLALLAHSVLRTGFVDDTVFPASPRLATPEMEAFLEEWADMVDEGIVTRWVSGYESLPLRIDDAFAISTGFGNEIDMSGALLPGGMAGIDVQGFAVSSGTTEPEGAYALVKYLTSNATIVNGMFGLRPARRSLLNTQSGDDLTVSFFLNLSPEDEAAIEDAFNNGLALSQQRFGDYLGIAADKMRTEGLDARGALQAVEADAVANLQAAADRRPDVTVFVATPVPTPVLGANEVSLSFGLVAFGPGSDDAQWQALVNEFIAGDPQVRQIVIDNAFTFDPVEMSEKYDCFFLPFNLVQQLQDLSPLLNLDPFLDTDPTFDRNDVIGTSLTQLQKDNKTWGFPVIIQPQVIWYDYDAFLRDGAIPPGNNWSLDQFNDALRSLRFDPNDPPPFVPSSFGGTYMLMLIAAYGGLPLDYRTEPPTANLTNPQTVDAIRQALDLAKDGYIAYQELGSFQGGGGGGDRLIYDASLNTQAFREQLAGRDNPYRVTTFPYGTQYNAASYNLGAAYISSETANPEACYRWISGVARHPEILAAMPVRRSYIDDPLVAASQGADIVAMYQAIADALDDPNTIIFPSPFNGIASPGGLVIQLWLYRAFDTYVLQDGDLDTALVDAEAYIKAYQECIADIPPFDPAQYQTQLQQIAYFLQYTNCAVKIDPSLSSLFSFGGGGG